MVMTSKFKEYRFRNRQSTKLAIELIQCLNDLKTSTKKKTEFVLPLEIARKNSQWEDYACAARRIIYSLKTELHHLSQDLMTTDLQNKAIEFNKSFKVLSSAGRRCIQLLKGFKNFQSEIKFGSKGYKLKEEATRIAEKFILLMSVYGIIPADIKHKEDEDSLSENGLNTSINISTSDLDSDAAGILGTENVRQKLSNLAEAHLVKNKKLKKGKVAFKIVHPNKKVKSYATVTEDLADGRKVQFIHDSLSHKLRKKNSTKEESNQRRNIQPFMNKREKRHIPLPSEEKTNLHRPMNQNSTPFASKYGVSEKAADAVFEKLIPYVTKQKDTKGNSYKLAGEEEEWIAVQIKLKNLSERLDILIKSNDGQNKFSNHLKHLISTWHHTEKDCMNLSETIKIANLALQKIDKYQSQSPSIDNVIENLKNSGDQVIIPGFINSEPLKCENFYFNLNANFNKNLRSKLEYNQKRKTDIFPSLQNELDAQRNEFWSSLVDNNYIKPFEPTSVYSVDYLNDNLDRAMDIKDNNHHQDIDSNFDQNSKFQEFSVQAQNTDLSAVDNRIGHDYDVPLIEAGLGGELADDREIWDTPEEVIEKVSECKAGENRPFINENEVLNNSA